VIAAPPSFPWGSAVFDAARAHLEATYPDEGCGVIIGGGPGGFRFVPVTNARGSATAFELDAHEHLQLEREASARGERIVCIVHSHPDGEARPSADDTTAAAPEGAPLYPDTAWLIVSIVAGTAAAARTFIWEGRQFRDKGGPDR
jgi:proteasome lid subunit RPN8/RPN11